MACGNLQLCAGLEAGTEGSNYDVGQRRLARFRERRGEEEEAEGSVEEENERGGVAGLLDNLTIETAGTEEEAAVGIEAALAMEVEGDRESEGDEDGGGTQRALGDLEFLTQEADPSGTTIVDSRNGFNELSCLEMLWTVQHRWSAGARFTLNCYRHWAQLLLRQPGDPPVTILGREGVTQGDPISMVLYRITLVPLTEKPRAADPGLPSPFYADDAAFDGSMRRSAQLLNLLMNRGAGPGILPRAS